MEFILEKEVKDIVPQAVDFNFEQLKVELKGNLEKYQNMVVTEENTKEAKGDRAKLNALKNSMDAKRKEIKKEWNVPYIAFEDKVKVLIGMIDEPIKTIDKQVKGYEEEVKKEKQIEIDKFFNKNIGDLQGLICYDKIHDKRWLNVGFKLPTIEREIVKIIESIKKDLEVIKDLELECEQQMIDKYLISFSMTEAMQEKSRWEDQVLKLAKYEKAQELKKQEASKEKARPAEFEEVEVEDEQFPGQVNITDGWKSEPKKTFNPNYAVNVIDLEQLDFRVWVTPEQKALLKEFLVTNNLKYGRVK